VIQDRTKPPWATILGLLFSISAGVVHLLSPEDLSFDDYTTQVVVVWSFLAVGRGFANREDDDIEMTPFTKFLNTFPWATAVTGVVAVVGYIGVITSDSLTFQELGVKLGFLIGALGLGRGIGVFKKDSDKAKAAVLDTVNVPTGEPLAVVDVSSEHEQRDIHDAGV
jgi:hypothetical protein